MIGFLFKILKILKVKGVPENMSFKKNPEYLENPGGGGGGGRDWIPV